MDRNHEVDWDALPLGKVTDAEIVRKHGVTPEAVLKARRARNIDTFAKNRKAFFDAMPLGKKPDKVVAEKFEVTIGQVQRARRARNIPAYGTKPKRNWKNFDWSSIPLGTKPDGDIAKDFDLPYIAVHRARKERGIRPYAESRWDSIDLGKLPDREIAKQVGCDPATVTMARKARGIAPCEEGDPSKVDYDALPLGEKPDTEIAREVRVGPSAIGKARRLRGIDAFRPQKRSDLGQRETELPDLATTLEVFRRREPFHLSLDEVEDALTKAGRVFPADMATSLKELVSAAATGDMEAAKEALEAIQSASRPKGKRHQTSMMLEAELVGRIQELVGSSAVFKNFQAVLRFLLAVGFRRIKRTSDLLVKPAVENSVKLKCVAIFLTAEQHQKALQIRERTGVLLTDTVRVALAIGLRELPDEGESL